MLYAYEKVKHTSSKHQVTIIDYLYRGRDFQRFWVVRRSVDAYFAFLSVLHFRESLGLRGQWHLYLMKEHFEQASMKQNIWNIWKVGAVLIIGSIVLWRHLVLVYYWINVVYYWLDPMSLPSLRRNRTPCRDICRIPNSFSRGCKDLGDYER